MTDNENNLVRFAGTVVSAPIYRKHPHRGVLSMRFDLSVRSRRHDGTRRVDVLPCVLYPGTVDPAVTAALENIGESDQLAVTGHLARRFVTVEPTDDDPLGGRMSYLEIVVESAATEWPHEA